MLRKTAAHDKFEDLKAMYAVEDHALDSVHCEIGSIENEVLAEEEVARHAPKKAAPAGKKGCCCVATARQYC